MNNNYALSKIFKLKTFVFYYYLLEMRNKLKDEPKINDNYNASQTSLLSIIQGVLMFIIQLIIILVYIFYILFTSTIQIKL